jgi:hypothetical protein
MEGEPTQPPLKVCPHCSVASRTDADTCPSCGKPYARSGPTLRWSLLLAILLAILIVAAAFLIGFYVISELFDGDDDEGISREQAEGVPDGISPDELSERLGGESETVRTGGLTCASYTVTDGPDPAWLFCFQGDKLVTSEPVPR